MKVSYARQAYAAIKDDIVSQRLQSGAFISEGEYAEKLGISRTPVREALKTLEREGLVEIFPRKGAQIKNFTLDDIMYIHEATEVLEGMLLERIAGRAARGEVPKAAFRALRDTLSRMDALLKKERMREWVSEDHAFHQGLLDLCDNPYLADCVRESRNRMNLTLWFITPKYADKDQSSRDHQAIMAAIEAGDAEAAREAATGHIARVRKNMVQAMGG